MTDANSIEVATLGGGCFWCLEAVFELLDGVRRVQSGYSGGPRPNPTYEQVCSGATGHAEVVQVEFDPDVISFREILEVFFTIHDPTTLNKQGADVGTQYRSVIFYHGPEQKTVAEQLITDLGDQAAFDDPIVTELSALLPGRDLSVSGEAERKVRRATETRLKAVRLEKGSYPFSCERIRSSAAFPPVLSGFSSKDFS
jgi:peptide-methionine (S)-S-oxide reductase